jgi:hypothetical protein
MRVKVSQFWYDLSIDNEETGLARSRINRGSQRREELRIRAQENAEARAQRSAAEQIELLDARLGIEVGARRERERLALLVDVEAKQAKVKAKEEREKREAKMSKKERKARAKQNRAKAKSRSKAAQVEAQQAEPSDGLSINDLAAKWGIK